MIGFLTGKIIRNSGNPILIDVGGVGYAVNIPVRLQLLIQTGQTQSFFIHTQVKDDAIDLYGFIKEDEHKLFTGLIQVTGIGPKSALIILNHQVKEITEAIAQADTDFFSSIPRIGRKNAQKIIIDMKNKMDSAEINLDDVTAGDTRDLITALTQMGFSQTEIRKAIKEVKSDHQPLEIKIKTALKLLSRS